MGTKFAPQCDVNKPINEYGINKGNRNGIQSWCLACCRIVDRKRNLAGRGRRRYKYRRNYNLKRQYGITLDDYNALFAEQDYKCKICKTSDPGSKHGWCVDHDHKTKIIRAVLCTHCNRMLGAARDNPDILRSAATFLDLMYVAY